MSEELKSAGVALTKVLQKDDQNNENVRNEISFDTVVTVHGTCAKRGHI